MITPLNGFVPAYVKDVDNTGFTIAIDQDSKFQIPNSEFQFNYHAFASPEAKLTVSDGTTQDLVLVVPQVAGATVTEQLPLVSETSTQPILPTEPPADSQPAPTDPLPPQEIPVVLEVTTVQPTTSPTTDPQPEPSLVIE